MKVLTVVSWGEEYGGIASLAGNVGRKLERNVLGGLFVHPDGTHTL